MADKLCEIQTPEYAAMLPRWTEYRRLIESGPILYDQLPQEANEDDEAWKRRRQHTVDLVTWSKTLQKQIDILALSGLKVEVQDDQLAGIMSGEAPGVDGCNRSLLQFLLDEVLRTALAYQTAYVVVDRYAGLPEQVTRAEAEALPMPYAYVLAPDRVPAVVTESASSDIIVHAITTQQAPVKFWSNGIPREYAPQWVEWTPELIRVEDEAGKLVREAPNRLGVVPILPFRLNDSLLRDMYVLTLEIMNHHSLAGSGAAKQIYGLPVICSEKSIDQLNVDQGLLLGKGDTFQLHQSPVEGLQFNMDFVAKLQEQIDKILTGRIYSMSVRALEQSGASKRMDNVSQENFSAYLADQLLRFSQPLAGMFGRYLGKAEVEVETSAPDEFVVQDRDADRQDATYFSQTFQAETSRQWVAQQKSIRRLSGLEAAMTPEDVQADDEELEAKAEKLFTKDQPIADSLMEVEDEAGDGEDEMPMMEEDNTEAGDGSGAGASESAEVES